MASLIHQLLSVAVVLGAVQLISGYSFNNCIEDQNKEKTFSCTHRRTKNITAIVDDLPPSTINLNISFSRVSRIPNKTFDKLPNLQSLRLDYNLLTTIDPLAFHNLSQLTHLNLTSNNLSELNPSLFEDLHSLVFLSLVNNTLKQLPEGIFLTVPNLETLLIRQNFLMNFSEIVESVSNLTRLRILDLCFNSFTSLGHSNVSLPQNLTTLYICRNKLSTLGCNRSFFSFIQLLDLSYNPRLPTEAFQGVDFRNVKYLRLRSTSVKIIEFLNMSNIYAGHVDFSNTGLRNDSLLMGLCRLLKGKVKEIRKFNLVGNEIQNMTNDVLRYCPKIKVALDLSHNELKSVTCLNFLRNQIDIKDFSAEHNHLTSLPQCKTPNMIHLKKLEELSYRYNRILSVSSHAFYHTPNIKTLKLNINTIAYLDLEAFKGLKKLETLRLDNNLLTDLFKKTFEDLYSLQVLNLRNNRIAVIFNETFFNLRNLTKLDLGGNKITYFQPSGLDGLKRLSNLYLDGNNLKTIDTSHYRTFQNTLTVLDLKGNQISFRTGKLTFSPFVNFSKLRDLKLDAQQPHGLNAIPRNFFRGLYSLKSLYLTNNRIFHLPPDAFDDLTELRFLSLDDCCVGVTQLEPGVFKNLRNLTKLAVENIGIQNFTHEVFGNLTKLRTLQLDHNVMQSLDVDALNALTKLHYLDIRNIPLSCTCENTLLRNWTVHNTKVQVVYLYSLVCPHDPRQKFYNFDIKVCFIDLEMYLFLSTAIVIFLFTVTPLLYVKLYWKMKYGYYVFRSWFSEQWRRLRDEEENCKYDAFISYNFSDEQWVMDELLPNLEGNGSSFKLCLHHRDFELGRDIVDNIVSAVYGSRKTICVVSRNFLKSEWCSLEIQLASYRLFDEHRDVLLLVFLEPISERHLSSYHRMRKIMLKKTYLQWPGSDCIDPTQAQDLFWNKLRRAIKTGSRLETVETYKSDKCVTEETESDLETSDENLCLQP